MDAEVVDLLREIRDRLAGLPEAIAMAIKSERSPRRRSQADAVALATLAARDRRRGDGPSFTLHQLAEHAQLTVAPVVALRETLATIDPTRLGRLLRRAADCGIDGFTVTAPETMRAGVKWETAIAGPDPASRLVQPARSKRIFHAAAPLDPRTSPAPRTLACERRQVGDF
jgi:hypothetical protein